MLSNINIIIYNLTHNIMNWLILLEKKLNKRVLPDKLYLSLLYKTKIGIKLDWVNPKTINEKLQWLKIYDRRPEYTIYVDKYKVRDYIAKTIGEEYLIPLLGVWNNPDEIDFDKLPNQFVLKCNHDSGGLCICKDKSTFDIINAKEKLRKSLKRDYYIEGREWPYKNVPRKIIAEKKIANKDGSPLVDYKFYCYGGKPRYFMYSLGEAEHNVRNHKFDMNLNSIDHLFKNKPTINKESIVLPFNIKKMIEIVEKLCVGFPHIRIDLYNVDGQILFGEMTLYSGSGFINIESYEYSQKMADLIDISRIKNVQTYNL